jgi:hypothetical protein
MTDNQSTMIPVDKISLNAHTPGDNDFAFTIDCGAVYFGAIYDNTGHLQYIDQYFYTENSSRWDLASAVAHGEEIIVDEDDFPVETYLLTKQERGEEWLRFHAVVPDNIDTSYFAQKYLLETE